MARTALPIGRDPHDRLRLLTETQFRDIEQAVENGRPMPANKNPLGFRLGGLCYDF
ncbi:hypothetical protein ABENE_11210 [Asticcacaulis benevestitus DSM 16100 = ATCC BAA-896]|uniref:Uncharacterized protein n=1 Tax=Asticcacaulis benevestitus DSM 16100 = ATCC BAA-896 TaxID=1121022 RepID=V4PAS4_9CAUL|nr:hypothetical protein ABENE_11210 [Asticcacaulis benevestitus DSM 16100 = ATCC BAA-896]